MIRCGSMRIVGRAMLAAMLAIAILGGDAAAQKKTRNKERTRNRDEQFNFDKTGIQPGQKLSAELTVRSLDGKQQKLADVWKDKPALVVTCSVTCPVARNRQREINQIAEQLKDKINIVMLYTVEAHPKTDPSPYSGKEWVTKKNEDEGILRRQPTELDERKKLAEEYLKRTDTDLPIVLDGMDNKAWKAVGGGPNLGLLVTPEGKVEVKHGWFDGKTMMRSIEVYLKKYEKSKK